MSEVNYDIYLLGKVKAPAIQKQCIAVLARLLKLESAKAEQLLSGKPSVLKRGVSASKAKEYKALLEGKGILVHIKASKATSAAAPSTGAESSATIAPNTEKLEPELDPPSKSEGSGIAELVEGIRDLTFSAKLTFRARMSMWLTCFFVAVMALILSVSVVGALLGTVYCIYSVVVSLFTGALFSLFISLFGLIAALVVIASVLRFVMAARYIARSYGRASLTSRDRGKEDVSFNLILLTKQIMAIVGSESSPSLRFSAQTETVAVHSRFLPGKPGPNIVIGLSSVLALSQAELVASLVAVAVQLRYRTMLMVSSSLTGLSEVCKVMEAGADQWAQHVDFYSACAPVSSEGEQGAEKAEAQSAWAKRCNSALSSLLRLQAKMYWPLQFLLLKLSFRFEQQWTQFKDKTIYSLLGALGYENYLKKQYYCSSLFTEQANKLKDSKLKSGRISLVESIPLVVASQVQVRLSLEQEDQATDKSKMDAFYESVIGLPSGMENVTSKHSAMTCYSRITQLEAALDKKEGSELVAQLTGPAYSVIERPQPLSKAVTIAFYMESGLPEGTYDVIPSQNYLKQQGVATARAQVLDQYYNGWFNVDTFWQFGPLHAKDAAGANSQMADINRLVRVLRHSSPDFHSAKRDLPELRSRYVKHRLALEIHKAGYRNTPAALEELGIVASQISELGGRVKHHKKNVDEKEAVLAKLSAFMGAKVSLVAGLVHEEQVAKQVRSTISTLAKLQVVAQKHKEYWPQCILLSQLCDRFANLKKPDHEARIKRLRKQLIDATEEISDSLTRFNWLFGTEYQNLQQRLAAEAGSRPPSLGDERYDSPEHWMVDTKLFALKMPQDNTVLAQYCDVWHGLCSINYELNMRLAVSLKKIEVANKVPPIKIPSVHTPSVKTQ